MNYTPTPPYLHTNMDRFERRLKFHEIKKMMSEPIEDTDTSTTKKKEKHPKSATAKISKKKLEWPESTDNPIKDGNKVASAVPPIDETKK